MLLPAGPQQRGGRWADHRAVINGIFFRTRAGCPWRDLPEGFGLRAGCDAAEGEDWTVSADSTVARAHQHAAGARRVRAADDSAGGFSE